MAVPAAPTAGEPIAEAWGDVVHDGIVAMDFQYGYVDLVHSAEKGKTAGVTFARPFASPPLVFVTRDDGVSPSMVPDVVQPIGTTSCTIKVYTSISPAVNVSGTIRLYWLAIGPRA